MYYCEFVLGIFFLSSLFSSVLELCMSMFFFCSFFISLVCMHVFLFVYMFYNSIKKILNKKNINCAQQRFFFLLPSVYQSCSGYIMVFLYFDTPSFYAKTSFQCVIIEIFDFSRQPSKPTPSNSC